jgi:hypothetical protein
MRPRSVIASMCRSRCVGMVSAVSLGTALERGGAMTAASGWRAAMVRNGEIEPEQAEDGADQPHRALQRGPLRPFATMPLLCSVQRLGI